MSQTKVPQSSAFLWFLINFELKNKQSKRCYKGKCIFHIKRGSFSYLNEGNIYLALCKTPKLYTFLYVYKKIYGYKLVFPSVFRNRYFQWLSHASLKFKRTLSEKLKENKFPSPLAFTESTTARRNNQLYLILESSGGERESHSSHQDATCRDWLGGAKASVCF